MTQNTKTFIGSIITPPDGYVVTYSATDGYYIPKPTSKLLIISSPSSTPYTITLEDAVLVQTHSGTFVINLPTSPPGGTSVYIKDYAGVSGTNPINIVSAALIDGVSPYVMNINYSSIRLVYNGITWSILEKF